LEGIVDIEIDVDVINI